MSLGSILLMHWIAFVGGAALTLVAGGTRSSGATGGSVSVEVVTGTAGATVLGGVACPK
jgi:hypothetical protein